MLEYVVQILFKFFFFNPYEGIFVVHILLFKYNKTKIRENQINLA